MPTCAPPRTCAGTSPPPSSVSTTSNSAVCPLALGDHPRALLVENVLIGIFAHRLLIGRAPDQQVGRAGDDLVMSVAAYDLEGKLVVQSRPLHPHAPPLLI